MTRWFHPRIRLNPWRLHGSPMPWMCSTDGVLSGFGHSPFDAYRDWLRKVNIELNLAPGLWGV